MFAVIRQHVVDVHIYRRYLEPVAYMMVIFGMSAIPGTEFPKVDVLNFDKLVHVCIYLPLGFLLARVCCQMKGGLPAALFYGALYAASDELHQSFVPFRSSDMADWVADCAGLMVGIWIWSRVARLYQMKTVGCRVSQKFVG